METTTRIEKSSLIIFDFEVFRYDVLFGAIVFYGGKPYYYQTWNKEDIKAFYKLNQDTMWIGHNNESYDNFILQAILNNKDIYAESKTLILTKTRGKLFIRLFYIDLMKLYGRSFYSLKMTEGACGKNISETEVDFDIDRALDSSEKALTESYNRDDLGQTFDNYIALKDEIEIRIDLCKEFHVGINHIMDTTAQLGAIVLGAKRIPGIDGWKCEPNWYDDLRIKNQPIIEYKDSYKEGSVANSTIRKFYLSEQFKKGMHYAVNLCGETIIGGSGGLHSSKNKYYCKDALYCDVSGFFNLIMMNKNLLPRTLSDEGKRLYKYCYEEQLRLKKINPKKRKVYKVVLLCVFGGMLNQYTDFYDPNRGNLVMITGQLYIIDLLQKLEGKIELVQTNTDGLIVKPLDWEKREEIVDIIREWEQRTGFTIKIDEIHNIWQRDVNCYMYNDSKGELHILGENAVYNDWENIFDRGMWNVKEPPIFAHMLVDFLTKGIMPEDTVNANKDKLRMFQYLCKKDSYDYLLYEEKDNLGRLVESREMQNVNRAFALKDDNIHGMIYKCKDTGERKRVQNLPDSVFICNRDIRSNIDDIVPKIDYDYYVKRGYDKILAFAPENI